MVDYLEPYWCDEHDPPVLCYEWCPACADPEEYYNWEEQEWSENKLFYENDLEHLLELPTKEKHR